MSSATFSCTDSDENSVEDDQNEIPCVAIKKLPPPNPLFQRIHNLNQEYKIEWMYTDIIIISDLPYGEHPPPMIKNTPDTQLLEPYDSKEVRTLFEHFQHSSPVYRKFNLPEGRKHYSSIICNVSERKPLYCGLNSDSSSLRFDSCFESGNLFEAHCLNHNTYELVLQNDMNTLGYTQWFFFSVQNTGAQSVIFKIVNLSKLNKQFDDSFYIVTHSERRKQLDKNGWAQERVLTSTYRNTILKENKEECYFTMEIHYKFRWENDKVYFAAHFPYTYTHLNRMIDRVKDRFDSTVLCRSQGGYDCRMLNITSSGITPKVNVLFIGRQHPGEVTGSFVVEGIVEFLTGKSFEAEYLRNSVNFRIVPMMNIDGVVYGHQRCTLEGLDMNRCWRQNTDPTIEALKKVIINQKHHLVIDFHSHSRKYPNNLSKRPGAFFYGNGGSKRFIGSPVFPHMVAEKDRRVDLKSCRFGQNNNQENTQIENTARVVLARMLNMSQVYTLESACSGYFDEKNRFTRFTTQDYKELGRNICLALFKQLYRNAEPRKQYPKLQVHDNVSQSDSDPADDQLQNEIALEEPTLSKQEEEVQTEVISCSKLRSATTSNRVIMERNEVTPERPQRRSSTKAVRIRPTSQNFVSTSFNPISLEPIEQFNFVRRTDQRWQRRSSMAESSKACLSSFPSKKHSTLDFEAKYSPAVQIMAVSCHGPPDLHFNFTNV